MVLLPHKWNETWIITAKYDNRITNCQAMGGPEWPHKKKKSLIYLVLTPSFSLPPKTKTLAIAQQKSKNLKIHWRLSTKKSVWSNIFWYVKGYIFWKFIQYTIHWNKTQMLKNFLWTNKRYEKFTLFSFGSSNWSQIYL